FGGVIGEEGAERLRDEALVLQNLYLGVRYDWTQDLKDQSLVTQTFGSFLTYYTTEFLRYRLGVEHTESDIGHLDGLNSAFVELNFVYGSHPSEPYWVNR